MVHRSPQYKRAVMERFQDEFCLTTLLYFAGRFCNAMVKKSGEKLHQLTKGMRGEIETSQQYSMKIRAFSRKINAAIGSSHSELFKEIVTA